MNDSTISGLPTLRFPRPEDELPIVNLGSTLKVQVQHLREGLPVASPTDKGLLSATDKAALDAALVDINGLKSVPRVATVASAPTIYIPDDVEVIILTGGANVVSVLSGEYYKIYVFFYPNGPGIEVFGQPLTAGDTIVAVYAP